ncbi:MAG: hypothetical protein AAF997_23950, partial [Myxococcota bacterium]
VTGQDEDPDLDLMKSVEEKLGVDDARAFRNDLLGAIAAWAIDHPETDVDYEKLFPRYIEQLRQAYYDERRDQIGEIGRAVVSHLEEDDSLDDDLRERAQQAANALINLFGYEKSSAKVALGALVTARYRD